jgi:hypothetical protein
MEDVPLKDGDFAFAALEEKGSGWCAIGAEAQWLRLGAQYPTSRNMIVGLRVERQ